VSATASDDLVRIDEAAKLLGRSMETLRQWSARGFASTGQTIKARRDTVTKIRYFVRADILRIRDKLYPKY
jgi:DNA-binding transcriptional MerR regulator